MSNNLPKSKEQLIYFLVSNISLGSYDKKFLTNLESMNVITNKPLTTNQAALLDKIILTYRKQIERKNIFVDQLLNLPWEQKPIASLPQYTETFIDIIDDEIIIRSPYKSNFIKDFRKLEINAKWQTEDKFWRIQYSTYTFKKALECLTKHFERINYCNESSQLIDMVHQINPNSDFLFWNPTYVFKNNQFLIAGTNRFLNEKLDDLILDDSLYTVSRLVSMGIKIDNSVKSLMLQQYSLQQVNFVCDFETKVDPNESNVVSLISDLKPDIVLFHGATTYKQQKHMWLKIKNNLKELSIPVKEIHFKSIEDLDEDKDKFIVSVESLSKPALPYTNKAVIIVNNTPIHVT
jgi:hypothetical protein